MNTPRQDSSARLERALELFLDYAGSDADDNAKWLAEHAELRDLLEPMLVPEHDVDADGATLGDFRLVRELGRGGMGVVHEAWQRSLDRQVALKVLAPGLTAEPGSVARFRREAAAVARLRHPGIVEVFGFGCDDGRHWFAMERVDGVPLQRCPERFREPAAAIDLTAQIADALQHAHAMGLVHRDVKPANVIVRADGSAVLTDFGLASDAAAPSVTTDGSFLGTLDYASPEQAQGEKVDARTDVWSLGVVLHELLAGQRPFSKATTAATLKSILTDEAADVRSLAPTVSADLAAVCARMLEKRPERRYASAAALLADLRALQNGMPVSARLPTTRERLARWARREPWRAATAAVLLLLVPTAAGALGHLRANAPMVAAAEAAARAKVREEVFATAFLAIYEDDPTGALHALERVPVAADDVEAVVVRSYCADRLGHEDQATAWLDQLPADAVAPSVRAWALGKALPEATPTGSTPLELFTHGIAIAQRAKRDDDRELARRAAAELARASLQYETPRAMVLVMWMQAALTAGDRATAAALEAALERHFPASDGVRQARAHQLAETDPARAVPMLTPMSTAANAAASTLFNLGLAHEQLGALPQAAEAYRRCIERNPQHARAHNNLGMVLRKQKDQAGAAQAFRHAVAADPAHHKAWNNLGITLRALGDVDAARQALTQALTLRPDYAMAHYNLGNLLLAQDDSLGAVAEFRLAIAADPSYVPPRSNLGNALRSAGQKQEALIAYALAAEAAPGDLIPIYNVGRTALDLGLLDLALSAAERACAIAPTRAEPQALRAEVLQAR